MRRRRGRAACGICVLMLLASFLLFLETILAAVEGCRRVGNGRWADWLEAVDDAKSSAWELAAEFWTDWERMRVLHSYSLSNQRPGQAGVEP